jgi:hypothetical protein
MPAKAGIQGQRRAVALGSRFRRDGSKINDLPLHIGPFRPRIAVSK